ncbi:DNA polymerase III subunit delta [Candidatus Erwinia haradaeae]|uniref:DNA polymerase III subunit delta n=1 Tax=Candidatus Erwinia haradaeae TaxID=1922217 RepID=A0A451D055_9GAMM|nr:DNA polymerase III subunit delta [Candidatus Erwinia haradaeae]VFP78665.1 DNA polymerase III subunit delta [Candidatus Erwinia haradaeae]
MIQVYPDKLNNQLAQQLKKCYILYGSNIFFIQEAKEAIHKVSKDKGFKEHLTISLDHKTDWQEIFSIFKEFSLFSRKKILFLILPEQGPNVVIKKKLIVLVELLHSDIILIIHIPRLTKRQENETWYKTICTHSVLVFCQEPEKKALPFWIASRAKQLNLKLDDNSNKLLCYYYEGNLLALSQALDKCSILWPNSYLTSTHIKQVIHNAACFNPFDWINALFLGNSQRALRILRQIRTTDTESVILLRILQNELLLLLKFKRKMIYIPLPILFDQYHVWQKRRSLLSHALQRLSITKLTHIFTLLTRIELLLKEEHIPSVWIELEVLTLTFSKPEFPLSFLI